jgi:hypothetical protein
MASELHSFKRVVLGLHATAPDRMQFAVGMADLLQLELLGVFIEDTSLHALASIPFAREFRTLSGDWHAISPHQVSHDLRVAARTAERSFADAAKRLATRWQFEVIQGSTAETIASVWQSGDIVVIVEPRSPAERATQQFAWLIDAALRSHAAVMLVPARVVRTAGPILAFAESPADPSISAAARIAVAAKEDLIIAAPCDMPAGDARMRALAAETGLRIEAVRLAGSPTFDWRALAAASRQLRERLIVVSRGAIGDNALTLASDRGVPVLIIEAAPGAGAGTALA